MADIAGFWSYVRADNHSVGNAIVKLSDRVKSEFELLSAERLRLFVDRDIEWGDEWKGRIDRELQETTFFIPIVTPRYFRSEQCRRELVRFKSAAERFGVKQLLLPIYYVTVPEMEEPEPQDELMALVKSIQREDMRKARLAEEWDATDRSFVNRLAAKLLKISRATEGLSVPPDEPPVGVSGMAALRLEDPQASAPEKAPLAVVEPEEHPTPESNGAGSLDVLAAGETALESWVQTVQELQHEIEEIGVVVEELTPSMVSADSFAAKLSVANKIAVQLNEPAENLTRIAQDYSTHLITVDPAVQTLIENARTDQVAREEETTKTLFTGILDMVQSARTGSEGIVELIGSMEEPSAASRELRQRLRRIQTSLRNVADGQRILDDWETQIREVYGDAL